MIIEIVWTCECGSIENSAWTIEQGEEYEEDTFYCYCSECGEEYPATNKNSFIYCFDVKERLK